MSASANVFAAVGTSWAATAVGFISYAIKTAKNYDAKFQDYIAHLENEFNNVLAEVQKVEAGLVALVPAPVAPAPAKATARTAKAPAVKRNLR